MDIKKMYIDGRWVESISGKTCKTINPATGEVLAEVTVGDVEDARLAVAAAKRSFYETRQWRDMDAQMRSYIILNVADEIEK